MWQSRSDVQKNVRLLVRACCGGRDAEVVEDALEHWVRSILKGTGTSGIVCNLSTSLPGFCIHSSQCVLNYFSSDSHVYLSLLWVPLSAA